MIRLLLLFLLALPVQADWNDDWDVVSTMGTGFKLNNQSSAVLDPNCTMILFTQGKEFRNGRKEASCGGDNPIFIGWPIAMEKNMPYWRVKWGWFHMSSIFDGSKLDWLHGDQREVHFDCVCMEATFNWSKRRRNR